MQFPEHGDELDLNLGAGNELVGVAVKEPHECCADLLPLRTPQDIDDGVLAAFGLRPQLEQSAKLRGRRDGLGAPGRRALRPGGSSRCAPVGFLNDDRLSGWGWRPESAQGTESLACEYAAMGFSRRGPLEGIGRERPGGSGYWRGERRS